MRNVVFPVFFLLFLISGAARPVAADQEAAAPSSSQLVRLSWKASQEGDMETLGRLFDQMVKAYEAQAKTQASGLNNFPARDKMQEYAAMNDVAVEYFIKAETLMHKGDNKKAQTLFEQVSALFPWAQSFDPSRGSYWSIKEKSQASIKTINGETPGQEQAVPQRQAPRTIPKLVFPGKKVIDYLKYGKFLNAGTKDYHYQVTDQKGLTADMGEGIYPNLSGIYKDPAYKRALHEGRLQGSHWDFVNTEDREAAIFKWATAPERWGVRLFYIGVIFEKAKMYYEAIKAYQSLIVFFPDTVSWTYWQTPWYPGQAAVAKIAYIVRMHPELHLEFKGARIRVLNSFDNDLNNDVTITTPGTVRMVPSLNAAKAQLRLEQSKIPLGAPVKTVGQGLVKLVKYANGHWQMLVADKPFLIKGITYNPAKVGQSPDKGTLANWMEEDENNNGIIDAPYEAWVDKNHNNTQDPDEPSVGDFALMKEMGVNTIRMYHHPKTPSKALLEKMFKDYGFMVAMGDFVGKYAVGSGAAWSEGTDYENPGHRKAMTESVRQMVLDYKDEPYILLWVLGNENNYGVASNADKKPEAYYKFINELALMIKSLDPNHPVAVCNGDTLFLDKFAQFAPDVDIYAANVYRGDYGFGSFWQQVAEVAGKPAFISEYGAPAFGPPMSYEEAQQAQSDYHRGNWLDIQYNSAGYPDGAGNAIGGIAFEWLDEWWKNYEPSIHDAKADAVGPFPGGYYYEEWFGLFGQGDGKSSPLLREPRKVYDTYKELWKS